MLGILLTLKTLFSTGFYLSISG